MGERDPQEIALVEGLADAIHRARSLRDGLPPRPFRDTNPFYRNDRLRDAEAAIAYLRERWGAPRAVEPQSMALPLPRGEDGA